MISCFLIILLHIEQCIPSVKPVFVHVASFAESRTSLCPVDGITSCFLMTSLHTEQCFPSVNPSSVHVAFLP